MQLKALSVGLSRPNHLCWEGPVGWNGYSPGRESIRWRRKQTRHTRSSYPRSILALAHACFSYHTPLSSDLSQLL
jgi:hypothetical protein